MTTGSKIALGAGGFFALIISAPALAIPGVVVATAGVALALRAVLGLYRLGRVHALNERLALRLQNDDARPFEHLDGQSNDIQCRTIVFALSVTDADALKRRHTSLTEKLLSLIEARPQREARIALGILALRTGCTTGIAGVLKPADWTDPELVRAVVHDDGRPAGQRSAMLGKVVSAIPSAHALLPALLAGFDVPAPIESTCRRLIAARDAELAKNGGGLALTGRSDGDGAVALVEDAQA